MRCPHCHVEFHGRPENVYVGGDRDGDWAIARDVCPACDRLVLRLGRGTVTGTPRGLGIEIDPLTLVLVHPRTTLRPPVPAQVPKAVADDYREACLVEEISPNAAAALGRRALRAVLREAGLSAKELDALIDEAVKAGTFPAYILDGLAAFRVLADLEKNPSKSRSPAKVMEAEPGEAGLVLDVLEALFEARYVQPARLQAKVQQAGKATAR